MSNVASSSVYERADGELVPGVIQILTRKKLPLALRPRAIGLCAFLTNYVLLFWTSAGFTSFQHVKANKSAMVDG